MNRPSSTPASLSPLPLVGRSAELEMLTSALDGGDAGKGCTVILAGESGVGKTRLAAAMADRARRRSWSVAIGRAFPVESGVPYALFSDALLPILRKLDESTLTLLSRGGTEELSYVFPTLAPAAHRAGATKGDHPAEFKTRLLWNFSQFLGRFAAKQPLLVILENLQWADASSLELLHFVSRQLAEMRLVLLCTYNVAERDQNPVLRATEQSLVALGAAKRHQLEPLSRAATDELVKELFGVDAAVSREFAAMLFGWTRGNPFFVEETLKSLVESGRLFEREGAWLGWDVDALVLPRTIREAVVTRIDELSANARAVANLAAVIGTRVTDEMLRSVSTLPREQLVEALDELRRRRVLNESADGDRIIYDFVHPFVRETLYTEIGLARTKLLHASVAEALEAHYGAAAIDHADELAFHFSRSGARNLAPKAIKYLTAAGRRALAAHANREAADYLSAALEQTRSPGADGEGVDEMSIVEDLARARVRLGEYDAAMELWARARAAAIHAGDSAHLADIQHRLGLTCYWNGRHLDALGQYEEGLAAASSANDEVTVALIRLAKGVCLQDLGRPAEAKREVEGALAIAERRGESALLARVHRALLLLHVWNGPSDLARKHGERALALAVESGQRNVEWTAHWALAMLGGFTGNAEEVTRHVAECERLAEELRNPLLRVWIAEISIEYLSATGDWDAGISLAERTLSLARSLGQRTLLPRMLVWSGLMYLGRGDVERAKRFIDEAWDISGAGKGIDRPVDVHSVVPAHTGKAAYHLTVREFDEAIRIARDGLAIADRTGYTVWAIHRLLPILAEAVLEKRDLVLAEQIGERLRRDSERLGQRAGLAWAEACAAIVAKLRGESDRAIELLRSAAGALEAIPFVADGARARRQLALVLAETGDREGAITELRRVHDVFARLRAENELKRAREQLRDVGARPPARARITGAGGLTGREAEIAHLVAARRSNKEIAKKLGISSRTVSTHLSNVFAKLGMESRGELADHVREKGLPE